MWETEVNWRKGHCCTMNYSCTDSLPQRADNPTLCPCYQPTTYKHSWPMIFYFLTEKSSAASKLKFFFRGTLQYFGPRSKQYRLETKAAHTWLVWDMTEQNAYGLYPTLQICSSWSKDLTLFGICLPKIVQKIHRLWFSTFLAKPAWH